MPKLKSLMTYAPIVATLLIALFPFATRAGETPSGINFQGRILKPNNQPLETAQVEFTLKILSPGTEECVLYEERQILNMTGSNGVFSLIVGSGTRGGSDPNLSLADIFSNKPSTLTGLTCASGSQYVRASGDERKLAISFNDGTEIVQMSPYHTIRSVPYALVANSLQGKVTSDFLQPKSSTQLSQTNLETVFANYTELMALINGTSSHYISSTGSGFTPSSAISFNSQKITNLADPSGAQDAATKSYTDAKFGGNTLDLTGLTTGQSVKWDGAKWIAYTPATTQVTSVAGRTGDITLNVADIASASAKYLTYKPNNIACSDGQVLKWSTSNGRWECGTDTLGPGTVTSVGVVTPLSNTGTATAPIISIADASTAAKGIVQLAADGGTSAGQVVQANDSRLSNSRTPSGSAAGTGSDLAGTYPSPTVAKIRGNSVSSTSLTNLDTGMVYRWNGTSLAFEPAYLNFGDLKTSAGAAQFATSCNADQTLTWSAVSDAFACTTIANLDAAAIATGTIDASRLPAASDSEPGIVSISDQTFAGNKTFSGQINVPTPVSGTNAANKEYVDEENNHGVPEVSLGVIIRHLASVRSTTDLHGSGCGQGEVYFDYSQDNSELGYCMEASPRTAATWQAAVQACASVGKRLPEPDEWMIFCSNSGTLGMTYTASSSEWTGGNRLTIDDYNFYVMGIRYGASGCSEASFQEKIGSTPKTKKFRCVY